MHPYQLYLDSSPLRGAVPSPGPVSSGCTRIVHTLHSPEGEILPYVLKVAPHSRSANAAEAIIWHEARNTPAADHLTAILHVSDCATYLIAERVIPDTSGNERIWEVERLLSEHLGGRWLPADLGTYNVGRSLSGWTTKILDYGGFRFIPTLGSPDAASSKLSELARIKDGGAYRSPTPAGV